MKAITIRQPWASLLACGAKQYETRSWATKYRGAIAIQAGKIRLSLNKFVYDVGVDFTTRAELALDEHGIFPGENHYDGLPYGAVIATAELVGCHKIVRYGGRGCASTDPGWLVSEDGQIYEPTEQEILFGDWTPGRYAWELANVQMLPEPVLVRGQQGLWNWGSLA